MSSNVVVRYEGATATADFSAGKWSGEVDTVVVQECARGTDDACDEIQRIDNVSEKTVRLARPGLYKLEFSRSLSWALGFRDVIWTQFVANLEHADLALQVAAARHAPLFSFHKREEFFPVAISSLFGIPMGDFQLHGLSMQTGLFACGAGYLDVCAGNDVSASDFMSRNGLSSLNLHLDASRARTIRGDVEKFPVYWFSQTSGGIARITYFVLFGNDQKRSEYVVADGGVLGPLGDHAVDRESVTVTLKLRDGAWHPIDVTYAGHLDTQDTYYRACANVEECLSAGGLNIKWTGGKTAVPWAYVAKRGDRPVAYVAEGSHAMTPAFGYYFLDVKRLGYFNVLEPAGHSVAGNLKSGTLEWLDLSSPLHYALLFSGYLIDNPTGTGNYRVFPFVRYPTDQWTKNAGNEIGVCVESGAGCTPFMAQIGVVTAVSPNTAVLGEAADFVITGINLPTQLPLEIGTAECNAITWLSRTATEHRMRCTPTQLGVLTFAFRHHADGDPIGTADISVAPAMTPIINTVSALKYSFDRLRCQFFEGGVFSALAEYKACGPAVVGDFELTFGQCVLRKSGANVTLSTTFGTVRSISASLDQTFSNFTGSAGDAVYIGRPDPNYISGSDESFNLFVGDFVGNSYLNINLRTNGRSIMSLSAQDFSTYNIISCGN